MITTLVVILGIGLTALAGWISYRSYRHAEILQTVSRADNAASAAKLALDRVALAVRAVRAMYAADSVTPSQFVRFAHTLMTSEGIRSLEFDRKVELGARPAYEQSLLVQQPGSIGIWQYAADGKPERAPDRPVYFVREAINYLHGTPPAIGFDVASLSRRAALINQSIASFDLVVSRALQFSVDSDSGVLLTIPALDRAGAIVGVATATITFDELATVAALASGAYGLSIAVGADVPDAAPAPGQSSTESGGPTPANQRVFAFGGQTWTVTVPVTSGGDPVGAWLVVLVIGAGLATTAALAAYLIGLGKTVEIAEGHRRLLRMLDGLGPLAWLLRPDGTIIHANRTASAELNRSEAEIVGRPFWDLPLDSEGDAERIRIAVAQAAHGDDARFDLALVDEAAGQRVYDLWIRPLGDSIGPPASLVASAVDITDRHESEQTQRLLMRELDHRMKNTLQVIQAVIRRTARAQGSVAMFERSLLGRVGAMSRAHDLLAEERWLGAEMNAVITREISSFDSGGGAVTAAGPRLRLNPRAALSIALVIHELGTNAAKYGALSSPEGRIAIRWERDLAGEEPTITLRWQESGGPEVSPPTGRGFGSMLIENSIAYELEGQAKLDFRPDGLICVITMPLRMLRPFMDEQPANAVS